MLVFMRRRRSWRTDVRCSNMLFGLERRSAEKSQAQEQVVQVPQSPDSLEDPEPPRKAATKISRCIACNKLVRCASQGHVNQQFSMADGFDSRCLSCSERCHQSFQDFAAHANTTAGAEDLAQ